MYALYAFFRHTDDLGDNEESTLDERRGQLDSWQETWEGFLDAGSSRPDCSRPGCSSAGSSRAGSSRAGSSHAGPESNHQWLPAVVDTVQRFSVPHQALTDVIDGCRQDLIKQRYENFEELSGYCHLVASSVGLACMHVWGFQQTSDTLEKAKSAGLAFQLTNILRDIPEDLTRQRLYLPQDELARFDCREEDLASGTSSPEQLRRLGRLFEFQVDRVQGYYDDALELVPDLSPEGQRIFRLMHGCYRAILHKIDNLGTGVLAKRVSLSRIQLAKIVAKELCRGPLQRSEPA